MFEQMRLKNQQMTNEEAVKLMEMGKFGVLASFGANGYPYALPINYVYDDGKIYVHSAVEGHKIRNFENCDKVSFCIISEAVLLQEDVNTRFKSVIAFGKISEVTDEEGRQKAFELIIQKLCPDFVSSGLEYVDENKAAARVFVIDVEYMTGKWGE